MSLITFGPIIGYVFKYLDKWSCRIVVETVNDYGLDVDIIGSHSTIEYVRFELGNAYIHRFIVHGMKENSYYIFSFNGRKCTLHTPTRNKEINIYTLSCDGGEHYSYYRKNARQFYNLIQGDESLWQRLHRDIENNEVFNLTIHMGDNFYCDDTVLEILRSSTPKDMLSMLQESYRKIFKYKEYILTIGSHLMMLDDHEYYDDYKSLPKSSDGTILTQPLINVLTDMFKYYQHILYRDPDKEYEDYDIYITDYAPLGIAITDGRSNRQYVEVETKYPILSEKQMNNMRSFFNLKQITSTIICFTVPLTLMIPFFNKVSDIIFRNAYDGWSASKSRCEQRNEILSILTRWSMSNKLVIMGGDLHFGQVSYMTNNKSVIPFIITSGISSHPPNGLGKLVYLFIRLFQYRYFKDYFSSNTKSVGDFNYCEIITSKSWNFNDIQTFTLKTYLNHDVDLIIDYKKSYSRIMALLSSFNPMLA